MSNYKAPISNKPRTFIENPVADYGNKEQNQCLSQDSITGGKVRGKYPMTQSQNIKLVIRICVIDLTLGF